MQTLDELIADAPLFGSLAPAHLRLIAGCGANEHLAAGGYLFREGFPADRFYLLRSGSIALEVEAPGRGRLVVETLQAGDVIGWSWLFEPHRWQFDARVQESTGVVAFDGVCLRGKCEADHDFGYELMQRFAAILIERLQATRLQLLDLYGHDRVL